MTDSGRLTRIESKLDTLIEIVRGFNTRITMLENARTSELRTSDTMPAPNGSDDEITHVDVPHPGE